MDKWGMSVEEAQRMAQTLGRARATEERMIVRRGEGAAVSDSGSAGASATLKSGTVATDQRTAPHGDADLRASLELPVTWNGCEGAAQIVQTWPAQGPDLEVCFDAFDHINVVDMDTLPAEFFAYVRDRVTSLSMHNNPRLVELPAKVSHLTSMTCLDISRCGIDVLPAALGACVALTYISVNECPLATIAPEVLALPALTRLFAQGCRLDALALIVVADGVHRSTSIEGVFVSDNPGSRNTEVAIAFAHALRSNGSLRTLQLFDVGMVRSVQLESALAIHAALERNKRDEAPPEPYSPLVKAARV